MQTNHSESLTKRLITVHTVTGLRVNSDCILSNAFHSLCDSDGAIVSKYCAAPTSATSLLAPLVVYAWCVLAII